MFNLFPVWGFYEQYCYDVQVFVLIRFHSSGRLLGAELLDHAYGKLTFNLVRNWPFVKQQKRKKLTICISLMANGFWASFHVLVSHLYICNKISTENLPLVSWVICLIELKNSLHIPDTNLLSDKWFANVFSQPIAHLFIFLIVLKNNILIVL